MKRVSIIVASVLVLAICAAIMVTHHQQAAGRARDFASKVDKSAKQLVVDIRTREAQQGRLAQVARVEEKVAKLKEETPLESLSKLGFIHDYVMAASGAGWIESGIPLPASLDRSGVYSILSNRRFRKVLSDLRGTNKAVAAQMVRSNLSSTITSYLSLYEADKQQRASRARSTTTNKQPYSVWPGFLIPLGPGEESKKVLLGERFKVLALVWICGILNLEENKEEVEQVVRLALKQRTDFYDDPTMEPSFKWGMLSMASLYNRQILSSALIGVTSAGGDAQSNAMAAAGIQWQKCRMSDYDEVSEFERPFVIENPNGKLTVQFVAPMSDTSFDRLVTELQTKAVK